MTFDNHPEVNFGKTGILIVNLGTPDSTSWLDVRRYLKEFTKKTGIPSCYPNQNGYDVADLAYHGMIEELNYLIEEN